jgi:hypothetical protein
MRNDPTMPRRPADVITLTGDAFARAVQVGTAASQSRAPMKKSAAIIASAKPDHPMNRFAVAVQDHFGDRATFTAFWLRWAALTKILNDPAAAPYTQTTAGGGAQAIHASVFDTAATMPLNDAWEFEAQAFYAEVKRRHALTSVFG